MKIKRKFYLDDGVTLAKKLLGKVLVHVTESGVTKGIIIETEAYMGTIDDASHSYKGKTNRTKIQYEEGGHAYIYMIYGMHYCMNIVANAKGCPESVLIRALEPIEGIDIMKKRRNNNNLFNLCNGPGKLCKALDITSKQYGIDLCGDELYLEDYNINKIEIISSKRVNIDYAVESKDLLWRFYISNNKFISKK